jgi:hypothetical protein
VKFARKLALSFLAILFGCGLGLIGAELLLRALSRGTDKYYLWPPNLTATFKPLPANVHGVSPEAHIQVNSEGIIGPEWGANRDKEYRILTLGGSTTECIMLDQSMHWGALVGKGLGKTVDGRAVWAGNVGRSGFNSRDHLGFMQLVVGQYDIDAVLLLAGANDFMARLIQGSTYDPHFVEDQVRYRTWLHQRFVQVPITSESEGPFYRRTAVFQLAKQMKAAYINRRNVGMDNSGAWLGPAREHRRIATLVDELPPLEAALDEYERNLTMMVEEARRRSVSLILLTQPTFWKQAMAPEEEKLIWMGYSPTKPGRVVSWPWWEVRDTHMYTTGALARGMAAYNQRLLDTCAKLGGECFDLAERVPRTTEVFFDDMHYTNVGSKRVASELVAFLKTRDPFRNLAPGSD